MPKTESASEEAGPSSKKARVDVEEQDTTPPLATRMQSLLFEEESADVHFVVGHPEKVRMQSALFYEPFLFCSRDELERLQPATQSLRDMIVKGSKLLLPLRPIWRVEMCREYVALKNNIVIIVKDGDEPSYEASVLDGDFEQTFRRLQNICVKDFVIGIRDNPFLRYWMEAQKTAAFTDFTVVNFHLHPTDAATIEVFGSIVNHLRPKAATFFIQRGQKKRNEGVLFLMCRDALLNNLETLRLTVEGKSFPLTIFFLDHSYAKYEVWMDGPYAANAIDRFIETFIRDGCANTKLESVYVGWDARDRAQHLAPKRLKKSTKVDMPVPKVRHMEPRAPSYRVSRCKSYSFVNTMQRRRMDVYKWTLARSTFSGAVYDRAYIVQFLMMDL